MLLNKLLIARLHLLLVVILGIISCTSSNKKSLKIKDVQIIESDNLLSPILINLSNRLCPDSLINTIINDEILIFNPRLSGSFRFDQADRLFFHPKAPLAPAQEYSVEFNSDLKAWYLFFNLDNSEIAFTSIGLTLEMYNAYWKFDNEKQKMSPVVLLTFNFPTKLEDIRRAIKVKINGKELVFDVKNSSSSKNTKELNFPDYVSTDINHSILLDIDQSKLSENGSDEDRIEREINLSSPYELNIINLNSEHDGNEGTINIRTSQRISKTSLKEKISINPKIKFVLNVRDDGFSLNSDDMQIGEIYELSISKGLKGEHGGELKENFNSQVSFAKAQPSIAIVSQKRYYLSSAVKKLNVKIQSLEKVRLTIHKIYENNIIHYANTEGNGFSYNREYYYWSRLDENNFGDIIFNEIVEVGKLEKADNGHLIDLSELVEEIDNHGIYVVELKAENDYYLRDKRAFAISDIGMIAKSAQGEIIVICNSIKDASAITGAKIRLYGKNNQIVATAISDNTGLARLKLSKRDQNGFSPKMIVAEKEGDFNFLHFNYSEVSRSDYEVGGRILNTADIDVYLYGDRNIYRPGEKMNFAGIVRDFNWNSTEDLPLKLKLISPRGSVVKELRKKTNVQGAFAGDYQIDQSAETGSYRLQVFSATDLLLNTYSFSVEEFVPDRIKVTTSIDKENYKLGEEINYELKAMNFFGPPAANRNYELEAEYSTANLRPEGFERFNFRTENSRRTKKSNLITGKTDTNGEAQLTLASPKELKNHGLYKARLYTTVFDETGRPVNQQLVANLHTQEFYFGIKTSDYYTRPATQFSFEVGAVNQDLKPADNCEAVVQIYRIEWRSVLNRSGSYYRYRSERVPVLENSDTVRISHGVITRSIIPKHSGRYEIRVAPIGSDNYTMQYFYSYGWGYTSTNAFEIDPEGKILIETDKKEYSSSDQAKILFKAPFDGKLLVSIERDKVLEHRLINTQNRSAEMILNLSEKMMPNAYVSATLFRPHTNNSSPLTVAHGYHNLKVVNSDRLMHPEIIAVELSRSKMTQEVKVKTKPGSFVTIAAVDEGILQVSNYKTPQPYDHFYAKRSLGVHSYDIYPYLFPEIRSSSTGGGDGAELAKRLNPVQSKRFNLISYWSGPLQADSKGEVNYSFNIPRFSGKLRIMAVTANNKSFGSESKSMTVSDPVVLSAGLPRFLTPRDKIELPLTISNTTNEDIKVKIVAASSEGIEINSSHDEINIKANSEYQNWCNLSVWDRIGKEKIRFEVFHGKDKYDFEEEIAVRPASPLLVRSSSGVISGKGGAINFDDVDLMDVSRERSLFVTRNPLGQYLDHLKYLVRYPHGCVEQTVSGAFPQLYLSELLKAGGERYLGIQAGEFINIAINKLANRQGYHGGFSYWYGRSRINDWSSVYATHFLLEAQKAGYAVRQTSLNSALGYLNQMTKNHKLIDDYYSGNVRKKIAPRSVIYAHFVLALASKPNKSGMNYYRGKEEFLSYDSKYMLAMAYALIGDKNSAKKLVPKDYGNEEPIAQTGGDFSSKFRNQVLALYVLVTADPDNLQITKMVKSLSDRFRTQKYLNTQERSFGLMALGKYSVNLKRSSKEAKVLVDGKLIAESTNGELQLKGKDLKGEKVEIKTSGEGDLYYFASAEGISESGTVEELDENLMVRRAFFTRDGNMISNNRFKQNDLVVVRITAKSLSGGLIENVAITDMLPAGFEIENPRINESINLDWAKKRNYPEYQDIRDDRINMFCDLQQRERNFYYMVRAVTRGEFILGPVGAATMYSENYKSYNGAGKVIVE